MGRWRGVLRRKKTILLFEMIFVMVYSLSAIVSYSPEELSFDAEMMQVEGDEENERTATAANSGVVVTPAFCLQKGIYYMETSYERCGIVRAGLIYDQARNGQVLVDNHEFTLHPKNQTTAFRVKIHDDSPIRFRLRLTGDAVEGDYIRLQQVHIISSKLTYVYRIFCMTAILLLVNVLLCGYYRFVINEGGGQNENVFILFWCLQFS